MKIDVIETCFDCSKRIYEDNDLRCSMLGIIVDENKIHKDCPLLDSEKSIYFTPSKEDGARKCECQEGDYWGSRGDRKSVV